LQKLLKVLQTKNQFAKPRKGGQPQFFKPIDITRYSNKPMLGNVKAVYLRASGEMGTFQKPFVMSMRHQNRPAFERRLRWLGAPSSNLGSVGLKVLDM
jgi:hypothetical protein